MITGSSKLLIAPPSGVLYPSIAWKRNTAASYGHHPVAFLRLLDVLVPRHLQRFRNGRPSLAGVDDVVDHGVAGGYVGVDLGADRVQHRLPGRLRVVRGLDRRAADDFD